MSTQDPPKIEFPCEDYPIKVLGDANAEMEAFVLETTESFAPGFDRSKVSIKASGKGRLQSITVFITATGVDQLQSYHQALIAHSSIKMVL
jgi:putative lipoic acid-binding regulatory protein